MLNRLPDPSVIDYICTKTADVPDDAKAYIRPGFIEKLGESVANLFPDFAKAFPLTLKAIEVFWPMNPKLFLMTSSVKRKNVVWVRSLVLEREDLNLFFNHSPPQSLEDTEGELFEQYKAMLPTKWKELYRWFDSFCITQGSMGGHVSENTPFDHASRLSVDDFCSRYGYKKADAQYFAKTLNSNKLRCWMVTDAGDSLWLDEQRCDHKVYHVKYADFKNHYVLTDPEAILDQYLADYVSGAKPADFDWRK